MSEIEKMYEKVGLASHLCKYPRFCDDNNCNECPNYSSEFTAEKQLELIKWLARFDLRIEYTNAKHFIESHYHGYSVYIECFEQALAGILNNLWQDLTEQEKQQIKEILE